MLLLSLFTVIVVVSCLVLSSPAFFVSTGSFIINLCIYVYIYIDHCFTVCLVLLLSSHLPLVQDTNFMFLTGGTVVYHRNNFLAGD